MYYTCSISSFFQNILCPSLNHVTCGLISLSPTLVLKIENGKENQKNNKKNEKENKKKLSPPLSVLTIH